MQRVETMSRRERVTRAVNHQSVDRMPIDLGVHYSSGISAFAYRDLRRHLGLPECDIEIADPGQFLARVQEDVLERFHCDCMLLHPGWQRERVWNPRGDYRFRIPEGMRLTQRADGAWVSQTGGACMPAGGFFFDGGLPIDDYAPQAYKVAMQREAARIYNETDYYTILMGFPGYFSDNPDYLCRMMLEPEAILAENERMLKTAIANMGEWIDLLGNTIQSVCIAADLGTQTAAFVRPSVYERLCAPFMKAFCDFVHQNSDYKVFFHSCGAIYEMLPIIVDCGVDVLNPVQINARGMEPQKLKAEFGDKLCFWGGGCDTQQVLGRGTPEQVRQNVRQLTGIFKKGSGFVFNQVHNVMGDVPPENIVAMLDEAYACAWDGL